MIVNIETSPNAQRMTLWRRQIGNRHKLAAKRGPRPFAVISYRVPRWLLEDRYVPLRQVTFVALFDQFQHDDSLATRMVGVAAVAGSDGLQIGGEQLSRFDKDLRLAPSRGRDKARAQLDAGEGEFFEYALSLERHLERCSRHPYFPRARVPRLPVIESGKSADDTTIVDLLMLPKRQVIRLDSPESDLIGRTGTATFDFVNTRFRVAR